MAIIVIDKDEFEAGISGSDSLDGEKGHNNTELGGTPSESDADSAVKTEPNEAAQVEDCAQSDREKVSELTESEADAPTATKENRAMELNRELFKRPAPSERLGLRDQSDEPEFNAAELKQPSPTRKIWTGVLACVLCMAMGFFGAALGLYGLAQTGFADSNSMLGNLIIDASGVETHKVQVNESELLYSGGYIQTTERIVDSVVVLEELVQNGDGSYSDSGSASGVIIDSNGYIVTNYHVTNGMDAIRVTLSDGSTHIAQIIGQDSLTDLAIIKMEVENGVTLTPATLGVSDNIRLGQQVLVIGNPLGIGITVTDGIVSCESREIELNNERINTIQTNAQVSPGSSGGGMFDLYGNLIGIICAKTSATGAEGLGYAIPIDTVKDVINDLLDYGYVRGRPAIGITLAYIFDSDSYNYYRNNELEGYLFNSRYGAYILSSIRSTELKVGDRLIMMDGERVISSVFLSQKLKQHKPGDKITLTIERLTIAEDDGNAIETHNVTIELYERDW
ncbi:MAG: trypsin-like peptidase domain-containing protein [Clostridia bacterium]|nr:trypsin-like peptidase domain-containing protein [Clostridia bacterium]